MKSQTSTQMHTGGLRQALRAADKGETTKILRHGEAVAYLVPADLAAHRRDSLSEVLTSETMARLKVQLAREGQTVAEFLTSAVEIHLEADYADAVRDVPPIRWSRERIETTLDDPNVTDEDKAAALDAILSPLADMVDECFEG